MMGLVVGLDELEKYGDVSSNIGRDVSDTRNISQEFRDKMLDQFLQDQFPAWSPELAFGKRDWDFVNDEVHIEMSVI